MKTYILTFFLFLNSGINIAQNTEVKLDSICIPDLKLIHEDFFKYLEKSFHKNSIKSDTLFLSINNSVNNKKKSNELLLLLTGGENYNAYMLTFTFKGNFYINDVCIIVIESDILDKIGLFESINNLCSVFPFTYEIDRIPPFIHGSMIDITYKLKYKENKKKK